MAPGVENDTVDRTLALVKTYQRMMDCSGELADLPICASGTSTFTEQDLLDFLQETLLPAFTVDHLVREFHLPIEETGWMLRVELRYEPGDLTSFFSAAPFHLTIQQIAPILEKASRKAGYYTTCGCLTTCITTSPGSPWSRR